MLGGRYDKVGIYGNGPGPQLETGEYHWRDHKNYKIPAFIRFRDLSEHGWELAAAYPMDNGDRIVYLLKRPVGQDPAG